MISFVYFDLGGVAVLDFSGTNKWAKLKRDIGIHDTNKAAYDIVWNKYKDRICISRSIINHSLPTSGRWRRRENGM